MLFHNLDPLVVGIANTKPDFFDGSSAPSTKPEIKEFLSHLIMPSHPSMPILSNFFLEDKGLDGSRAVVRKQILDWLLLEHHLVHLLSWGVFFYCVKMDLED